MGACLLLSGIVAAIVTAPLFDRVFTHHLAITIKLIVPILAGTWLSLIWAGMFILVNGSPKELLTPAFLSFLPESQAK